MGVNRGPIGARVLQGLLQLARKHPVVQLDCIQEHELIRDLTISVSYFYPTMDHQLRTTLKTTQTPQPRTRAGPLLAGGRRQPAQPHGIFGADLLRRDQPAGVKTTGKPNLGGRVQVAQNVGGI